jgi:hypothetical protein
MKQHNTPDGSFIHATVKEFADIIGEDYLVATGITKWLVNNEVVKAVGKQSCPTGKGKPAIIFAYPQKVDLDFWPDGENTTPVVDGTSLAIEQSVTQASLD